ncbi:MAG: hypothetical protein GF311_25840 [Candidatus Lokiarchaeota archaeon]|nr:hypothetical protein [Candidatus Lokiarchaeota archaeon]
MKKIQNNVNAFIISTGRTGTKFLTSCIRSTFNKITLRHEPGREILKLRFLFGTSKITKKEAIHYFLEKKYDYYAKLSTKYYIESNPYLILLIPIIRELFPKSKIIFITRDGRDWLRSAFSRGLYGSFLFRTKLPIINILRMIPDELYKIKNILKLKNINSYYRDLWRIRAPDFKEDPFRNNWRIMDQFERLAWKWQKLNDLGLKSIENDKNSIVVKFEEIFNTNDFSGFFKILDFLKLNYDKEDLSMNIPMLFSEKINKTNDYLISHWKNWNREKIIRFNKIAGGQMKKCEYNLEY